MRSLAAFAGVVALAACSQAPAPVDAGPSITAQAYYGLTPGQCFEYAEPDAGLPTLGLRVAADATGLELHFSRHGQEYRVDYLTFDGGLALLTQEDALACSRAFQAPLAYAQAPLAANAKALISQSAYTDTLSGGFDGNGQEGYEVDVLSEGSFTSAAGTFPQAFELQLTPSADGGCLPLAAERRWVAPDAGFVDIYTTNDFQQFVDYSLVDVKSAADAGCAAN
ncbi:MAG: hypothetical protein ACYDCL_21275 [Myxococcales bacterium]